MPPQGPLQHRLGPRLHLLGGADVAEHNGHENPGDVEEGRRIGADEHLLSRPTHQSRHAETAQLLRHTHHVPVAADQRVQALLDTVREAHLRIDDFERRPIGFNEARRKVFSGEALDLVHDVHDGVAVEILERLHTQHRVKVQHIEEVELEIAKIALVVTHRCPFAVRYLLKHRPGGQRRVGVVTPTVVF